MKSLFLKYGTALTSPKTPSSSSLSILPDAPVSLPQIPLSQFLGQNFVVQGSVSFQQRVEMVREIYRICRVLVGDPRSHGASNLIASLAILYLDHALAEINRLIEEKSPLVKPNILVALDRQLFFAQTCVLIADKILNRITACDCLTLADAILKHDIEIMVDVGSDDARRKKIQLGLEQFERLLVILLGWQLQVKSPFECLTDRTHEMRDKFPDTPFLACAIRTCNLLQIASFDPRSLKFNASTLADSALRVIIQRFHPECELKNLSSDPVLISILDSYANDKCMAISPSFFKPDAKFEWLEHDSDRAAEMFLCFDVRAHNLLIEISANPASSPTHYQRSISPFGVRPFINNFSGNPEDDYSLAELAEGTFGKILEITDEIEFPAILKQYHEFHKQTAPWEARAGIPIDSLREMSSYVLLSSHPNIASVHSFRFGLEEDRKLWMGMKKFDCNLMGMINQRNALSRSDPPSTSLHNIQKILKGILSGLAHARKCGIAHRDLCPQNVLLELETVTAVLIDFGMARRRLRAGSLSPWVQKMWYRAPELSWFLQTAERFEKEVWQFDTYDAFAIDMWSAGVILGELLMGGYLFTNDTQSKHGETSLQVSECLDRVIRLLGAPRDESLYRDSIIFPAALYTDVAKTKLCPRNTKGIAKICRRNEILQDLFLQLLEYDSSKRITADQALCHPFFSICFSENEALATLPTKKVKLAK